MDENDILDEDEYLDDDSGNYFDIDTDSEGQSNTNIDIDADANPYEDDAISDEYVNLITPSETAKRVHSIQIIPDDKPIYNTTTQGLYKTISYNGINSWDTWRLIPSSRPVINPPEFKSTYIEIPGTSGTIDVSTLLSAGQLLYADRRGSIEFYVTRDYDDYHSWSTVYQNIMTYLHGKKVKVVLLDDPAYYYVGRMTVNQWRSEKDWSKIVLDYVFEPYKLYVLVSSSPWLWDPFDFVNGVITDSQYYIGSDGDGFELISLQDTARFVIRAGSMPIIPTFKANNDTAGDSIAIKIFEGEIDEEDESKLIKTHTVTLNSKGDHSFTLPTIPLIDKTYTIFIIAHTSIGSIKVSMAFRNGSL